MLLTTLQVKILTVVKCLTTCKTRNKGVVKCVTRCQLRNKSNKDGNKKHHQVTDCWQSNAKYKNLYFSGSEQVINAVFGNRLLRASVKVTKIFIFLGSVVYKNHQRFGRCSKSTPGQVIVYIIFIHYTQKERVKKACSRV